MQKTKNQQTAVIYARARGASRAQEDDALEAQISGCHHWVESHGYTIGKTYIDRGKGASRNLEECEGLFHLLRDTIQQRSFDVILVQNFNRLYRSVFEFVILRTILSGSTCN
jgi:DNA invertase Pin-like site-specific DNA recombinase